jgi:membrane-associated protease RseP (regulator of RpoE activity)
MLRRKQGLEWTMTRNVGTIDRAIRIVLGLILIAFALGWIFPATGFNWIGWLGLVLIATALVSSCPAYSLLGTSTRERD